MSKQIGFLEFESGSSYPQYDPTATHLDDNHELRTYTLTPINYHIKRKERVFSKITIMEAPSLLFQPFSTFSICGATSSGKSEWMFRFLRHAQVMFDGPPPEKIYYCYGIWTKRYSEIQQELPYIIFHEGLPTREELEEWSSESKHTICVLDDMAHEIRESQEMELLFTRYCHHLQITSFFLMQVLFQKGRSAKAISQNSFYTVLFRLGRDISSVAFLGRQMYPGRSHLLTEAYSDAMSKPYNYLVVDSSPHAIAEYRLRSQIFPGEDVLIYLPKKMI